MLQLRPVPGNSTVVRGPPEIELRPLLAKLKRRGPRRALRRKRKGMGAKRFRGQGVGRSWKRLDTGWQETRDVREVLHAGVSINAHDEAMANAFRLWVEML
jgi:hypothetical protein